MSSAFNDSEQITQLGRYHSVSQIAVGGMAEIYVARMEGYAGSKRLCVIKEHPYIVQMFEVGAMDGNHFIAMEYLHGEDGST